MRKDKENKTKRLDIKEKLNAFHVQNDKSLLQPVGNPVLYQMRDASLNTISKS